jgi:lysozyme
MKTSQSGIDLICQFEGYRAKAYRDSVGVLTIGYGHTSMAGSPQVTAGMVITNAQARDLAKFEASVLKVLTRSPSQNQFDAMVSLCYNIGGGNFAKSSVVRLFNAGDFAGAGNAFAAWNKAGGKALAGLTTRRAKEAALFRATEKPVTAPPSIPATPQPETPPSPATPKPMGLLAALIALILSIFKRK